MLKSVSKILAKATVALAFTTEPLGSDQTNNKEDLIESALAQFAQDTPLYPAVETNQLTRQRWGYGSVVKDIFGYAPQQYDETPVVYESRVPVQMDNPKYDVVGQLVSQYFYTDENNKLHIVEYICSSTIVRDVEGYDNALDAELLFTSGHCVEDKVIDGVEYSYLNSQYITNYVDINGDLQKFVSGILFNSLVSQNNEGGDIAIAILETSLPAGMQTAVVEVDMAFQEGQIISVPAYSSDKQGLHSDDCEIKRADYNWNINTCDIQKGASGSPQDLRQSDERIVFAAITSSFFLGNHVDKNLTRHSNITSEFLDTVSYLQRVHEGAVANVSFEQPEISCLAVTATKLNVRSGPSIEFDKVAHEIPNGAIILELGRSGDWSKIKLDNDDQYGYIAREYNGRRLTQTIPCPL